MAKTLFSAKGTSPQHLKALRGAEGVQNTSYFRKIIAKRNPPGLAGGSACAGIALDY